MNTLDCDDTWYDAYMQAEDWATHDYNRHLMNAELVDDQFQQLTIENQADNNGFVTTQEVYVPDNDQTLINLPYQQNVETVDMQFQPPNFTNPNHYNEGGYHMNGITSDDTNQSLTPCVYHQNDERFYGQMQSPATYTTGSNFCSSSHQIIQPQSAGNNSISSGYYSDTNHSLTNTTYHSNERMSNGHFQFNGISNNRNFGIAPHGHFPQSNNSCNGNHGYSHHRYGATNAEPKLDNQSLEIQENNWNAEMINYWNNQDQNANDDVFVDGLDFTPAPPTELETPSQAVPKRKRGRPPKYDEDQKKAAHRVQVKNSDMKMEGERQGLQTHVTQLEEKFSSLKKTAQDLIHRYPRSLAQNEVAQLRENLRDPVIPEYVPRPPKNIPQKDGNEAMPVVGNEKIDEQTVQKRKKNRVAVGECRARKAEKLHKCDHLKELLPPKIASLGELVQRMRNAVSNRTAFYRSI